MSAAIEQALGAALAGGACCFGQISIARSSDDGFVLKHRGDEEGARLQGFRRTQDAIEIARFDDAGNYRPLKTAPNLRHGWRLEVVDLSELARALDYFYPGRLAMLYAWKQKRLRTTPLRETLDRQSGIYRIAAKISDERAGEVVGTFCRSDDGCLRTILWKCDARGAVASTKLPAEKFDPGHDQTGSSETTIPLLCQEACNLLVNECRKAVKSE